MHFLKKILGRPSQPEKAAPEPKPTETSPLSLPPALDAGYELPPAPAAPSPEASSEKVQDDPAGEVGTATPSILRFFDPYGRELTIERKEWRAKYRAGALKSAWTQPEALFQLITSELTDGQAAEMLEPARQLHSIDPVQPRGATVLGACLMELQRWDEAEEVFKQGLKHHEKDPVLLANLSRIQLQKGEKLKAQDSLWKSLQADPNQPNAVRWFLDIAREVGGEQGAFAALERIGELPGSWGAQLGLARHALEQNQREQALEIYSRVLALPDPLPLELLAQLSADLGAAGQPTEMLERVLPRFSPAHHGLRVGHNLLKALVDIGQTALASQVIEALYQQQQPEWREALDFWQSRVDERAMAQAASLPPTETKLVRTPLEGPVWAFEAEGFHRLLPAKDPLAPRLAVLAPSVTSPSTSEASDQNRQESDAGSFGRALTLHLVEQIHLGTSARALSVFTQIANHGGFVLSNVPFTTETALSLAGKGEQGGCDFALNLHIDASQSSWLLRGVLLRVSAGETLHTFELRADPRTPEPCFRQLSASLRDVLVKKLGFAQRVLPAWVGPLTSEAFVPQMIARMQVLELVCATLANARPKPSAGARRLFDELLHQALVQSKDPIPRLLLITALNRHRVTGSPAFLEYERRLRRLVEEFPQDNPATPFVLGALNALYPVLTDKPNRSESSGKTPA